MIEFGNAPAQYSQTDQASLRRVLRAADAQNVKKGEAVDRLYFKDRVTGETGLLTVESGVVTWTAI